MRRHTQHQLNCFGAIKNRAGFCSIHERPTDQSLFLFVGVYLKSDGTIKVCAPAICASMETARFNSISNAYSV